MKTSIRIGSYCALLAALFAGVAAVEKRAVVQAPRFEVDPMSPKPLPNHWVLGMTIGVSVDAQDHVWIIHRGGSLDAREVWETTTLHRILSAARPRLLCSNFTGPAT
jgi:hypothetical protein